MKSPKVSVIMPVYNAAAFLKEAVHSVLNQTFTDFELLIINDGSVDDSVNIINELTDPRIVLINQKNQGVATACQNGLLRASGRYIWRHDADDVTDPAQLHRQVDFLKDHIEFNLVSTGIRYMTARGKKDDIFKQPATSFFKNMPFREVKIGDMQPISTITHATVLATRESLIDVGGYRKEFITSEDLDLWLRFLEKYKAAILNFHPYYVRIHGLSITKHHSNRLAVYKEIAFEYHEERIRGGLDSLQQNGEINLDLVSTKASSGPSSALDFHYGVARRSDDVRTMFTLLVRYLSESGLTWKFFEKFLVPLVGKIVGLRWG